MQLCAEKRTRVFGPVIYNTYGSTEVAYATIATPEDLAAQPNCLGRIVPGAVVKLFDEHGQRSAREHTKLCHPAAGARSPKVTSRTTSANGWHGSGSLAMFASSTRCRANRPARPFDGYSMLLLRICGGRKFHAAESCSYCPVPCSGAAGAGAGGACHLLGAPCLRDHAVARGR